MKRSIGTVAMGIRTGIVKPGDDLVEIVTHSLLKAVEENQITLHDRDVLGITESILARAQGNYVEVGTIAEDIKQKFPNTIGLLFPILSRNRFSIILKGIIASGRKVVLQLSYPSDEVGNSLMDENLMDDKNIDPYNDVLTEKDYRRLFGKNVKHEFTGVDYVQFYKDLGGEQLEIIFSNNPKTILNFSKDVLVASVHTRERMKKILKDSGADIVLTLDEIMNSPINSSGYNKEFGLLGSNLSSDSKLKLFPRDSQKFVEDVQKLILQKTGIEMGVMVYGDGAFKDPAGRIWELADPVVSPGYTSNLKGTPNELKLKYIADTELANLNAEEAAIAMKKKIQEKKEDIATTDSSLGTTPRRITDLLGSLCDLTSGSGDKGTPFILIQGYFDNYATE